MTPGFRKVKAPNSPNPIAQNMKLGQDKSHHGSTAVLGRRDPESEEPEPSTLERAQDAALARKAVDSLAERDRLALLMREEGLDYTEIADALGLSVGSIGTTLARARRRLAEAYEAMQAEGRRDVAGGGHAAS